MYTLELKYGTNYPEACPPTFAKPISGEYYRLCKTDPPTPNDFITHFESNRPLKPHDLCDGRALSFFTNLDKVIELKKMPFFRNHVPVNITIKPEYGIGEEKDGHLNLWEFSRVNFIGNLKED